MNAAVVRNVFAAFEGAVLYLHGEPGNPLAAGVSELAAIVCTAGHKLHA